MTPRTGMAGLLMRGAVMYGRRDMLGDVARIVDIPSESYTAGPLR